MSIESSEASALPSVARGIRELSASTRWALGSLLLIAVAIVLATVFRWTGEASLEIGVIGNSSDSPETYAAIKYFVEKRVQQVNREGGINGRRLEALFRDNGGDNDRAADHVRELVARKNLIALIGIWNSSRAERVMPIIEMADVPLIGYFSDTKIYRDATELYEYRNARGECEHLDSRGDCLKVVKDHPGVYTGIIGLTDESLVFKHRLAYASIRGVMYLGQELDRYSNEYLGSLDEMGCSGLIEWLNVITVTSPSGAGELHKWQGAGECARLLKNTDESLHTFDAENRQQAIGELLLAQLEKYRPDILVLSLGSIDNARIIEMLSDRQLDLIVYSALGDIGNIIGNIAEAKRGHKGIELWDTADQGIPHANNQRLEELYSNSLNELAALAVTKNVIGFGGIYSDLAAMLAEAAVSGPETDPESVRRNIVDGMQRFQQGEKIYQGWANDWWFTSDRSAARDSRLAWSPSGRETYVLDPVQFTFTDRRLIPAEVLYTSIDVIEFRGLDDKDGEVDIEFYLGVKKAIAKTDGTLVNGSLNACRSEHDVAAHSLQENLGLRDAADSRDLIDYISFTNAAKSKLDQAALLDHRRLSRDIEVSDGFVFCTELYQVSGRFSFQPDLRRYPFDRQTIQISIQASDNEKPVLVQPLALELQDKDFHSQNWRRVQHYVGVDQDLIKSLSGYGENVQLTPFYKFNFTWTLERELVDYFLKVILPVLVICLITYASAFIPHEHFEATAGIQVTCLLAAIALYLSIDKPSTSFATLSDWVFVATYVTVTSMVVLSIGHAMTLSRDVFGLRLPIRMLQIVGYPLWVIVVIIFLYTSTASSL